MEQSISEQTLTSMKSYYRERAREYDEWFYRQGRYDRGAALNIRWFSEAEQVFTALTSFNITGEVLEMAPGTGIWTKHLVQTAEKITAVDASVEMIEINRAKVHDSRIAYIQADLFTWQPEQTYDAVFFGFWISHIPLERLDSFLEAVAGMLRPEGKVFFVDGRRETTSTATDHQLPTQEEQIMTRKLNDGQSFQIVKNFYDPIKLAERCKQAGLQVTINETKTYFLYGYGQKIS